MLRLRTIILRKPYSVSIVSFTFTIGWNYIEHSFTTNSVLNGNAIGDTNGLVIQIGPFHYTWSNSTSYSVYGQIFGGVLDLGGAF